ncbi:hypothetical protein F5Y11DRAFT_281106 [Daldinia sp. FL1419]|nr:hypothetical protein F5Y11DRAFT_281106 [Daldinia sp. FL1419]
MRAHAHVHCILLQVSWVLTSSRRMGNSHGNIPLFPPCIRYPFCISNLDAFFFHLCTYMCTYESASPFEPRQPQLTGSPRGRDAATRTPCSRYPDYTQRSSYFFRSVLLLGIGVGCVWRPHMS